MRDLHRGGDRNSVRLRGLVQPLWCSVSCIRQGIAFMVWFPKQDKHNNNTDWHVNYTVDETFKTPYPWIKSYMQLLVSERQKSVISWDKLLIGYAIPSGQL